MEPGSYAYIFTPPCTDDVIELDNKTSSRRKASSENTKNPIRKYFEQSSGMMKWHLDFYEGHRDKDDPA